MHSKPLDIHPWQTTYIQQGITNWENVSLLLFLPAAHNQSRYQYAQAVHKAFDRSVHILLNQMLFV